MSDILTRHDRDVAVDFNSLERSDSGNAEAFAATYRDRLRYDWARRRWYIFDSHTFRSDDTGLVGCCAKKVVRARSKAATEIESGIERRHALQWALKSESRERRQALLDLARSEPLLRDTGKHWDEDRYLLGTPNGVIDLRTGEHRPGRVDDRITLRTGVEFNSEALCPRWERFIDEVTSGDHARARFLQCAVGYSVTGVLSEQVFLMMTGDGANGKTTFLDTVRMVMGDYAYAAPITTFVGRGSAVGEDLAALAGRRLVIAAEPRRNATLNEGRLKSLVGGDRQNARHLYGHPFQFDPQCTIWLAVNEKPRAADSSRGFWRKVLIVPFESTFTGSGADKGLKDTLQVEAAGILNWIVAGCFDWQQSGLKQPDSVTAATDEYERESDPLTEFIDDCLTFDDASAWTGASTLYAEYRRWCDQQGIADKSPERITQHAFGRAMGRRADKGRDPKTRRKGYLGIQVQESGNRNH